MVGGSVATMAGLRCRRRPSSFHRGVAWLLLATLVTSSMGVMPSARRMAGWFGTVLQERYPCEHCGCGCASATECWSHCCCHTPEQRLQWAIEHGVMPPASVRFGVEAWISAANAVQPGSAHCEACVQRIQEKLLAGVATARHPASSAPAGDSCCAPATDQAFSAGACGRTEHGASCCADSRRAPSGTPARICMSALNCKGLEQLVALPMPPTMAPDELCVLVPEAAPYRPQWPTPLRAAWRALDAPEPPPRA